MLNFVRYAGLLLLVAAAGCGVTYSGSAPSTTVPPSQQTGSVTISPKAAAVTVGQTVQFTAASTGGGNIVWSVNDVRGGNNITGTISSTGVYTPPVEFQTGNVQVQAALASAPTTDYATASVALIPASQVSTTANPQVASYSITLPQPGTVSVQFGPNTNYGLTTWSQPTPTTSANTGGTVTIEVAGMRGSSTYHMQAVATLANEVTFKDVDHTFVTGAPPPTAPVQITTPSSLPPQPGVELFDTLEFDTVPFSPSMAQAFVTDLAGNVLWTYTYQGSSADAITPIKLLSNGHFLLNIANIAGVAGLETPAGTINDVREIDLAGNAIHDLPIATLAQSLTAAGFKNLQPLTYSHDILSLPNGHLVLLTTIAKQYTNLPGYPGTIEVLGDLLVDVDANYKPDWVWNAFDHLDINRHPLQFPDWTHSDAMRYSADDHNLLVSMRNQNWVIKIDYQDGTGSGDVLWRLGEGGDFTLVGGTDPTDWFYAQHGMAFFSPSTAGVFKLGLMDDGDDRQFPPGVTCGSAGAPPCLYSTVPEFEVDEGAKTATLIFHYVPPPSLYSFFGGQVDLLADGDVEADFCAVPAGATVEEVQPNGTNTPELVWQAISPGFFMYRAIRLPSLYPGVQW